MKTVVITGTNHGLGLALTKAFLAAGWRVAALARTRPDIAPQANLRVEICDLTDIATLAQVVARLKGVPIDVLINNAGVYDAAPTNLDAVTKDFDKLTDVFQVNSIVPKILADALAPNILAGQEKLVVTMSSGMGTYAEFDEYHAEHWAYSASKAAVNYAMISYAKLHPEIKVALINPGWIKTAMGGSDALLTPEEAAGHVFDLVANHADKLPNAKLVDYEGKGMDL